MRFEIETKVKAQERYRTATRNGKTFRYTPKQTKDFQKLIQKHFTAEIEKQELELPLFEKGQEVALVVYVGKEIPKSYSKKRVREILENGRKPTTKPDVDNYGKIVMDALNKLAYHDDAQISTSLVKKMYVKQGTPEKLLVDLERDLPPEIIKKMEGE